MSATERRLRRGDVIEVAVDALDAKGGAVGTSGEYRVHLRHGLPGQRVRAAVRKRRRLAVEAEVLEELAPAPDAVAPLCKHFASCGGCSFQDLAYTAQLAQLGRRVRAELDAAGAAAGVAVEPVLPAQDIWRYRNKMELGFHARRWIEPGEGEPPARRTDFALGLHARGVWGKGLDLDECRILFEDGEAILRTARRLALEQGLEPWDARAHTGLLRHLVLRHGARTGEVLVYLVTSRAEPERVDAYAAALVAAHPGITTLVQGVRASTGAVAVGESERVLHGPGTIRERVGGLELELSPTAFFQTNTAQAEALLEIVREEAACTGSELVLDLYCGGGVLGLGLAPRAARVVGLEQVGSAVRDARANALRNGLANAAFVEGDVLRTLRRMAGAPDEEGEPPLPDGLAGARPDVLVLDPPRSGLHPAVVPHVIELAPRRIVFVSCNVGACAPDVARLEAAGWRVLRARPLDLFPHTPHVECVLTLERAGGSA